MSPHLPSPNTSLAPSLPPSLHSAPPIPYPPSLSLSLMATASFQPLHQPFLHHHHSFPSTPDSSLFLRPTILKNPFCNIISSVTTASSVLTPTTAPASSFDVLAHHLAASDFRQADEETRRLLIALAGEPAQKRGYVFFSEAQFIPAADFRAIDRLWRRHSNDRFGYSVQRRLWEKSRRDFSLFFVKVGWMKKLDTEVEQFNYRLFPDEFIWELRDDTPEGHLPLTNALRGTQLLASILTHPAFDDEEEGGEEDDGLSSDSEERDRPKPKPKPGVISNKGSFTPDYSF